MDKSLVHGMFLEFTVYYVNRANGPMLLLITRNRTNNNCKNTNTI